MVSGLVPRSAFVAIAVVLAVSPARAGDQAPSADARDAIEQARRAYAAGRTLEAIEGYKRAYELSGDASLLFRLGEMNREIGNDVAAARFYRTYLAREPHGKDHDAAEKAARRLELGTAAPPPTSAPPARPPQVQVSPPPAVDTQPDTPPPSSPAPPSPSPPPSLVPPAEARVAPAADLQLHATATPAPPERAGPPLPRWLPWVGLGVTLGLGAGAVITGLGASHRYDQLRASCGRTPDGCAPGDINQVKSRALTANLLWAATGVSAVATGVMVYVNTREAGFSGVWSF